MINENDENREFFEKFDEWANDKKRVKELHDLLNTVPGRSDKQLEILDEIKKALKFSQSMSNLEQDRNFLTIGFLHRLKLFLLKLMNNELPESEFRESIAIWIKFCLNNENRLFFDYYDIDREQEIEKIIYKNQIIRTENEKKFETHKGDFHSFFNTDDGKKILNFLLDKWFLPRYDLISAKLITAKFQKKEASKNLDKKEEKRKKKFKNNVVISFLRSLFNRKFFILIPLLLSLFSFGEWPWNWCWSESILFSAKIEYIPKLNYYSYPFFYGVIALFMICAFFLKGQLLLKKRKWLLSFRLLLPRLIGGIIIGYLPLLMTDEIWKWLLSFSWGQIIILVISSICLSYFYIFIEISNTVTDRTEAFHRTTNVVLLGLIESLILGILVMDFFGSILINNLEIANISMIEYGITAIYGIFGIVIPKVVISYFPLALLLGIFVQLIWEEKPITQPL